MSDSLKNNEYYNELIRYRNNLMSDKECYQFERSLERDPFLFEASEGFEEFKTADIDKDLSSIDLISGKRKFKLKINKSIVYAVAAGVAILVVSILFINRDKSEQMVKYKPDSTNKVLVFTDSTYKEKNQEVPVQTDSVGIMIAQLNQNTPLITETENISSSKNLPIEKEKKPIDPLKATKTQEKKPAANKPPVISSIKATDEKPEAQSLAANSTSNSNTEEQAVSQSVENTVPIQSSQFQPNKEANLRVGVNANPEPLGGFDLFKNYIDKNMVYPFSETDGSRETVKVQFKVSTTGQLVNIKVEKAPDNSDFTQEAIRLLQNGPKWSPAIKDGVPVEKMVDYRIVFKPK